ncbi:MAG: 16S rRNA (cytidine(1402)-2'-O)-methyltransferase [Bacteroidales bacterium]|jgi:16S rRNA (cytidine1402-2'-O)-methyltransferase|nr:16S rRNA (cytidine(1402)-2'-O)-methyltransferase [Bacteroidales bacterium]
MGKLFIVPTPVGNLEDITLRALRVLREADSILAEDTRVTKKLLMHYDIDKPIFPYHQYNEHRQLQKYIQQIERQAATALVSDAGTPAVSDPGFLLVRACIENNIEVECLPGATAFVPALVNSGFPCDRFYFYGFLPHKKGRKTAIERLSNMEETVILYESPFRLLKTLEQFNEVLTGDRLVCVCRELTKIYEETVRGTVEEVIAYFSQKPVKGEIVLLIQGKDHKPQNNC